MTTIPAHEAQAGMYLTEIDGVPFAADPTTGLGLIEGVREPRDDVELTVWGRTKMFIVLVGRDMEIEVALG